MNGEGYKLIHACSLLSDEKEIKFSNRSQDWFFYKTESQNVRIEYVTIWFSSLSCITSIKVKGKDEQENDFDKIWRNADDAPLSVKSLAWLLLREFYSRGVLNEY